MIAMAHSALHRNIMLDWLKHLDDEGIEYLPDLSLVQSRFDYETPEQARTLIAELSDRGLIRLDRKEAGAYPKFKILPPRPVKSAPLTVNRNVDDEPDRLSGIERIKAIVQKVQMREVESAAETPAPVITTKAPSPPSEKPLTADWERPDGNPPPSFATFPCGHDQSPENSQRAGRGRTICRQCWRDAYDAKRPRKVTERQPRAPYVKPDRCTVSFTIHPKTREWLSKSQLTEPGVLSVDEMAHVIFMEGLQRRLTYPDGKPLFRGIVLRQWKRLAPDKSLGQYVTSLVERGLAEMLREAGE